MDAPPELLAWARETANGITRLVGLVRRREIEMTQVDFEMIRRHEQDLYDLLERNKSTDPGKWVPPQRDDAVG